MWGHPRCGDGVHIGSDVAGRPPAGTGRYAVGVGLPAQDMTPGVLLLKSVMMKRILGRRSGILDRMIHLGKPESYCSENDTCYMIHQLGGENTNQQMERPTPK